MVRLKHQILQSTLYSFYHFNSTMVRLKLEIVNAEAAKLYKFQFHYGSIEAEFAVLGEIEGKKISIPLWFD
ncbi:hypothetical protein SAMN05444380_11572 [Thermophagus xiamenensis]|uniref:Uncharacterized protein n=1 Tax=Thermophagus xiamenensis TaxID=385682 RepID=A0A1I2C9Y5_9BACT|nr:hypothetical protein SAMN05444380_11572 [Thermophagus xiamenensis]